MSLEILATPVAIGRKTAPNRFVNQPMECNDADESGNPSDLTLKRYHLKIIESMHHSGGSDAYDCF